MMKCVGSVGTVGSGSLDKKGSKEGLLYCCLRIYDDAFCRVIHARQAAVVVVCHPPMDTLVREKTEELLLKRRARSSTIVTKWIFAYASLGRESNTSEMRFVRPQHAGINMNLSGLLHTAIPGKEKWIFIIPITCFELAEYPRSIWFSFRRLTVFWNATQRAGAPEAESLLQAPPPHLLQPIQNVSSHGPTTNYSACYL